MPMNDARLTRWMDAYRRAWNTNDRADIEALFAPDATYRAAPYEPARVGRDGIVSWWLAHQDQPGQTTFRWEAISVTDEVAVVEGTTTYPGQTFSNLWVIRLDADGICVEFTEWWMLHPAR
jgi:SnoaL-like domain